MGVQTMCEKCKEIDIRIARFERLIDQTTDKIFLAGVAELLKIYFGRESRAASDSEVRPPQWAASFMIARWASTPEATQSR
jgi:hypothetical protein